MKLIVLATLVAINHLSSGTAVAQTIAEYRENSYIFADDAKLLDGYTEKFKDEPKEILLAMIKDDSLSSYKMTAAIRVLREQYASEIVSREKRIIEKIFLRRLARTNSPFVQVELMYTLIVFDRYRYFKTMIPALIQKLDHYNKLVGNIAYEGLEKVTSDGSNRAREARIIFNTLRKVLFLSRKRLQNIKEPGSRLVQKLSLLRWSIKVLGTHELKRLPKEVINLL